MADDFKFEWRWCLADNLYFYGEDAWQMISNLNGEDAWLIIYIFCGEDIWQMILTSNGKNAWKMMWKICVSIGLNGNLNAQSVSVS